MERNKPGEKIIFEMKNQFSNYQKVTDGELVNWTMNKLNLTQQKKTIGSLKNRKTWRIKIRDYNRHPIGISDENI